MTAAPIPVVENAAAGRSLTPEQSQRAWCLRAALMLTAGRGVPIQGIERIARWLYTGEVEK